MGACPVEGPCCWVRPGAPEAGCGAASRLQPMWSVRRAIARRAMGVNPLGPCGATTEEIERYDEDGADAMTNPPAQILVVDDEANIRLTLHSLLTRAGYAVALANNGDEAIALLHEQNFDLLLVDLKMPGTDGMEVVAAGRASQPDMTIIVLTGHGSLETAIEGLRYGIFDYLLKTTAPDQVVERVRAGLNDHSQKVRQRTLLEAVNSAVQELRSVQGTPAPAPEPAPPTPTAPTAPPTPAAAPAAPTPPAAPPPPAEGPSERVIQVGDLQIDTWRQAATFAGRLLMLTPTEFRVLLCLAEHAGKMLTYTQIVRCAQGYEASEPEASELIKPHIYHLRQKLEPDPSTPRYLLNVRGKGYMLQV